MSMNYSKLLQDPRWQRKRLEVMQRADFACEECGSRTRTLNVHHKQYRDHAFPWEYSPDELQCLCRSCHEEKHAEKVDVEAARIVFKKSLNPDEGRIEELLEIAKSGRLTKVQRYELGLLLAVPKR